MICKPRDFFRCSATQCVPWSDVCDGVADCDNKADEVCDMCTNDLYTCKDLSRINCTLACSTLGYIPCKNYMDKKICETVIRRQKGQSNSFFNYDNFYFLNSIPTESIFIPVLGFLTVVFVLGLFLLFCVHFKRSRLMRKRRKLIIERSRQRDHRAMSDYSSNSLEDYHYPQLVEEDGNILNKSSTIYKSTTQGKDECSFVERNDESFSDNNANKSATSNQQLLTRDNRSKSPEQTDHYGEPPPTYKQAKYFPIADLTKENTITSKIITANEINIYENIDDIVNKSKQRRAKFQGVKKGSNNSRRQSSHELNQSSTESINMPSSSLKNVSSPINESADN